ncbi:unnamed protein product [Parnassius mnemosyne]|uniref:Integrase catalytic domain-containing protein n=1 Tax=Parnassius mnemosyne TaxID=213953 RepID=A0AAV1LYA3_9NEOP
MATKAVHLELVSDLTSSAFLAALRRMAARRGAPRHIYCDNGTNFVGASRVLEQNIKQLKENISDPEFLTELTKTEIEFHFNAPSWPSAGGLLEAAVKSLKYHIKRVIGEQKLTFEEYSTILTQLEATGELEKDADSFQANLTTLNENIKHLKSQNVIAENITFHDIHHYVAIYILVGVAVIAAICLACKRLRQRRNTAITSSISLDNITTEGLSSAPVAALAAPRAQRAAAVPAPRTQPVAASTERASSPAVPNAFNTQDRATSPILRTLILKRDEE